MAKKLIFKKYKNFVQNGTNYSYSKIKNISIAEAYTFVLTLDSHIHPA